MIEILDSETFYYHSADSHQGRHTILHRHMMRPEEPGNYLLTVHEDTYYLWKTEEDGTMRWLQWSQCEIEPIRAAFFNLEYEHICDIQPGHDGFYACLDSVMALGSEIDIIPRMCYTVNDAEKWTVDLILPSGTETCTFWVYGEERIQWFNGRAILDYKMNITLRNFQFQGAV